MAEVIWTKLAVGQLERAVKYIKVERGTSYAQIVLDNILESTRNLKSFPQMGSIEPLLEHKKSEYRYLVVWSYKVIYRVGENKIVVSRVFHTSQSPSKIFKR